MAFNAGGAMSGAGAGAKLGSAIMPGIGTAIGAVGGGILGGMFGGGGQKAPKYVPLQRVDLGQAQKDSTQDNLENMGQLQTLLAQTNQFQQDQAIGLMEKAMPGFGELQGMFSEQIRKDLTNPYELPDDLTNFLKKQGAEGALGTGTSGQFNTNSLLKNFGLQAMGLANQRIGRAQSLFGTLASTAPNINPASPLNFMTTAGQQADLELKQNLVDQSTRQAYENAVAGVANANRAEKLNNIASGLGSLTDTMNTGVGPTKTIEERVGNTTTTTTSQNTIGGSIMDKVKGAFK